MYLPPKSYLNTICHFSDWIEVHELWGTLATTIICKTKVHTALPGVASNAPAKLITAQNSSAWSTETSRTTYS